MLDACVFDTTSRTFAIDTTITFASTDFCRIFTTYHDQGFTLWFHLMILRNFTQATMIYLYTPTHIRYDTRPLGHLSICILIV